MSNMNRQRLVVIGNGMADARPVPGGEGEAEGEGGGGPIFVAEEVGMESPAIPRPLLRFDVRGPVCHTKEHH
jgi:hypothetical protein